MYNMTMGSACNLLQAVLALRLLQAVLASLLCQRFSLRQGSLLLAAAERHLPAVLLSLLYQ